MYPLVQGSARASTAARSTLPPPRRAPLSPSRARRLVNVIVYLVVLPHGLVGAVATPGGLWGFVVVALAVAWAVKRAHSLVVCFVLPFLWMVPFSMTAAAKVSNSGSWYLMTVLVHGLCELAAAQVLRITGNDTLLKVRRFLRFLSFSSLVPIIR